MKIILNSWAMLTLILTAFMVTSCTPELLSRDMESGPIILSKREQAIAQLSSNDSLVRLKAAYQLGEMGEGGEGAISALISATADPDPDVRSVAAYALGKVDGEGANSVIPILTELLTNDEHENVRYSAARSLGNLGATAADAMPDLMVSVENDPSGAIRSADLKAATQLGVVLDENAIEIAIHALGDPNWYVRRNAAAMLAMDPVTTAPKLVALLNRPNWNRRNAIINTLPTMGDDAFNAVKDKLHTTTKDDVRDLSAVAFILMEPNVSDVMDGISPMAEPAALHVLGYLGEYAVPTLLAQLGNEDESVRNAASDALAHIGLPAIPSLVEVFKNDDEMVRTATTDTLLKMDALSEFAVPPLLELLQLESDQDARRSIVKALGEIGLLPSETVPTLITIADDPQESTGVRVAAIESLGRFGEWALPALPTLTELLQSGDDSLHAPIVIALGEIGPGSPSVIAAFESILADSDADEALLVHTIEAAGSMGELAQRMTPALLALLEHDDPDIQRSALEALGSIGAQSADVVSEMMIYLEDNDPRTVITAIGSIGRMGPVAALATPALLNTLDSENDNIRQAAERSFSQMGVFAVASLVELLTSEDESTRSQVARALGVIGADAMPSLLVAFLDEETSRQAVVQAFYEIGPQAIVGIDMAAQYSETVTLDEEALADIFDKHQIIFKDGKPKVTQGFATKEAIPFLAETLQTFSDATDSDTIELKRQALSALGFIGPDAVHTVPMLQSALQDDSVDVRCQAVLVLIQIGPEAAPAAPMLAAALREANQAEVCTVDEDDRRMLKMRPHAALVAPLVYDSQQNENRVGLQRVLVDALAVLGPASEVAIPELVGALDDERLRAPAAESLRRIGSAAVPALVEILKDADASETPELAEALQGKNNDIRRSAAYALLIGDGPLPEPLQAELIPIVLDESEDISIRTMVAAALQNSGYDLQEFWDKTGAINPLVVTCPQWEGMFIDATRQFDIYYNECIYQEAPQAPPWRRIFRRLVQKLGKR